MGDILLRLNRESLELLQEAVQHYRTHVKEPGPSSPTDNRLQFIFGQLVEAQMTKNELQEAKIELLDAVHELASDPIPDLDAVKAKVNEVFKKLEDAFGQNQ